MNRFTFNYFHDVAHYFTVFKIAEFIKYTIEIRNSIIPIEEDYPLYFCEVKWKIQVIECCLFICRAEYVV